MPRRSTETSHGRAKVTIYLDRVEWEQFQRLAAATKPRVSASHLLRTLVVEANSRQAPAATPGK